jgi:Cellulose binding domain
VPVVAGNAPAALRRAGGRLGNARARWRPPARTAATRVLGRAPVPAQTSRPTTATGHRLAREGLAWLRSVPGWSAERRSRAVALGALLLLLIALVMVLVARFTVRADSAPPQVGGGADQHGPGFAVVPGQTGRPPATASVPGASALPPVGTPATASAAAGASPLTAAYRTTDRWVGGYRGEITVANPGTRAVDGWTVTVTLPLLGIVVDSVHGAQSRQTGKTVTFTPVDAARAVPPGAAVTFDFAVNGVGQPTGCTVDARACAGVPG